MQRREVKVGHLWTQLGLQVGRGAAGERAQLANRPRRVGGGFRQPLGTEDDQAHQREDHQLGPSDVAEHQSLRAEPNVTVVVCR